MARLEAQGGLDGDAPSSAVVRNDMRPRSFVISAQGPDGAQTITAQSAGLLATLRVSGRVAIDQAGGYMAEGASAGAQVRLASTLAGSLGATSLSHAYVGETFAQSSTTAGAGVRRVSEASAFYGGRATSNMPKTGAATYVGAFQGRETIGSPGVSPANARLRGDMTLDADFAAATLRGRIDQVQARADGAADWSARAYGVSLEGVIRGAALSAESVSLVDPNTGAPLSKIAHWGAASGGFFGPGAAEAAGALALTAKEGRTQRLITGAFGLKRR